MGSCLFLVRRLVATANTNHHCVSKHSSGFCARAVPQLMDRAQRCVCMYMGTCGDRCGLSLAVRSGFEFVWVQALVAVAKGDALGGGLCTGLTTAPAPVASHRPWAGRQLHNTLVDRLHEPPFLPPLRRSLFRCCVVLLFPQNTHRRCPILLPEGSDGSATVPKQD